jgi:hypothetical protein
VGLNDSGSDVVVMRMLSAVAAAESMAGKSSATDRRNIG